MLLAATCFQSKDLILLKLKNMIFFLKKDKKIPKLLKVIEKRKIVDIELHTIEHPKTATKLSNPIKQSKVSIKQGETV